MTEYTRTLKRKQKRIKLIKRRVSIFLLFVVLLSFISVSLININAKADSSSAVPHFKYYKSIVVKSNDTLWDYANEYAPNGELTKYVNEVMRMNHLNDETIYAGMHMIIPYYSDEYLP